MTEAVRTSGTLVYFSDYMELHPRRKKKLFRIFFHVSEGSDKDEHQKAAAIFALYSP
jgi:hypothetical protein